MSASNETLGPSFGPEPEGRRWLQWAGWAVALMLALGVLVMLLWPGTAWWVEHVDGVKLHGEDAVLGKDRQDVLDKARARITAVVTGILAVIAIYYTAVNARSARQTARAALRSADISEQAQLRTFELTQKGLRQSEEAQRHTLALTERGQLTDRFTAAVAQLGEASPAIRLGGVHALAGIADDAPTMRQTCIDVLCAYLRLPYDPDPGEAPEYAEARRRYRGRREVRHTIIRLIGNHLRLPDDDPRTWQGHDFDFTDVIFDGGDLSGCRFSGGTVSFARSTFSSDFNFTYTNFSRGRVDFNGAIFSSGRINFENSKFSGSLVSFFGAKFSGGEVNFWGSRFSNGKVTFAESTFSDGWVVFDESTFSGGEVSFRKANFSGGKVSFWSAGFSGSDVSFFGTDLSEGEIEFEYAEFSGGTVTFKESSFSGSRVGFENSEFTGGRVDFQNPKAWDFPPVDIEVGPEGQQPEGVFLPEMS